MDGKKALFSAGLIVTSLLGMLLLTGNSLAAISLTVVVALGISLLTGHSAQSNLKIILSVLKNCLPTIGILLLTASMVGVWKAGGTMATILYYLLSICKGMWIAPISFIICALMAWMTGSSNSIILSIGSVMLSIGISFGLSPALLVGAVASGALLGNAISPVSDAVNLTASMCSLSTTEVRDNLRGQIVRAGVLSLALYCLCGLLFGRSAAQVHPEVLQVQFADHFHIHLLCMLPLLALVLVSILRLPALAGLSICLAVSVLTALFSQSLPVSAILRAAVFGYHDSILPAEIHVLLEGSGIISLSRLLLIVVLSAVLGGVLSASEMIQGLILMVLSRLKRSSSLPLVFYGFAWIILIVSGSQMIPTISLATERNQSFSADLPALTLSKLLLSTSVVGCVFIPWNATASALVDLTSGSFSYIPYAFFCMLLPILELISLIREQRKP